MRQSDDDSDFIDSPTGPSVFEGDTGKLTLDQRLCLNALLKRPYISAEKQPAHWEVLLAEEPSIRSTLNDLLLDLRVDRAHEVAYKMSVPTNLWVSPSKAHTLVESKRFSREESILLMYLRREYRAQQGQDAFPVVNHQDIRDHISKYLPYASNDAARAQQTADTTVKSLVRMELLSETAAGSGNYRILPIIEPLLPVESLEKLKTWMEQQVSHEESSDAQ